MYLHVQLFFELSFPNQEWFEEGFLGGGILPVPPLKRVKTELTPNKFV